MTGPHGSTGAVVIDGKASAAQVREEVARDVAALVAETGRRPGLATVLIGADPASEVYVRNKRTACRAAGMEDLHRHLPADVSQEVAKKVLDELAADDNVSGILLQLPLPNHLDRRALLDRIPAEKDVDGLTVQSAGLLALGRDGLRPCTPAGVLRLLDDHAIPLRGAEVVVVGRSELVGRPLAQLLTARDATVTLCHSRTVDLAATCRRADVVVAAVGVPRLIGADAVRPGAVVIDVGIHREAGGLCGDVDFGPVAERAGHISPVPGGVGPMTIAMLLANTALAARRQFGG
ncbi:bifunctional methylenetetrahydrofolate dehydrogenase/methenyltetrahydrofolate cyclohydrolase FolD [Pseudonocardia kujensis]|uniref:bifunctional methylenetetrahydrofolate dehydrogenase/methenyltetrahydrofolate cyclohydrolase FolD n=1 Tax=Pseudonocardia kujensis TaxID=1128675 RepID=UPI001E4C245A|nr:bifunctional methylenetetrahydrofolate dehydrogenase/methenyltetrahydrofolate cyclohydrolase FolD [Pseudonocardia kujensis]MCE0762037.1 bifunctional methylenetetrahydrofolate dehydrogenase/methenyltetrahydrofolate cyclohydrolase FolD [Pseudonocardia kujensis]